MNDLRSQRSTKEDLTADSREASLSEIVSAFSYALDLTEAAVPGHAIRCCLLGMTIAALMRLPDSERTALYYALLLKDIGCSNNSAQMCELIGGDDRAMKHDVKLLDWTRPSIGAVTALLRNAMPGASAWQKAGRILRLGLAQHQHNELMIGLRCDRGASIVRKIGLSDQTAQAIRSLDEHWDGSGYPDRARGEQIPLLARVMAIAQHLDVFGSELGMEKAISVMRARKGRWFDPELVNLVAALDREGTLRILLKGGNDEQQRRVVEMEPSAAGEMNSAGVDRICEAFADVVDAKSSFTYTHSLGVTKVAQKISAQMGFAPQTQKMLYRAALLHDLGKLSVPNSILDKPGKLDAEEWAIVRGHAALSQEILSRIPAFRKLAVIAGQHHERLDGRGYPYGLTAQDLSLESRLVAVADVFGSLTETRPYRPDLPLEKAIAVVREDAGSKLDAECVEALLQVVEREGRIGA
uniref:HD domain-containing protein n=1 Tax=Acidobacterium capsulatum TaxID=33075 RepID=A0A7V4XT11_9BACT